MKGRAVALLIGAALLLLAAWFFRESWLGALLALLGAGGWIGSGAQDAARRLEANRVRDKPLADQQADLDAGARADLSDANAAAQQADDAATTARDAEARAQELADAHDDLEALTRRARDRAGLRDPRGDRGGR